MIAKAAMMYQRYCSQMVGSLNRTTLPGGNGLSPIPQRFKARQSNIGTPPVRLSNGNDAGAAPRKIRLARSPARLPIIPTSTTKPPTEPTPTWESERT